MTDIPTHGHLRTVAVTVGIVAATFVLVTVSLQFCLAFASPSGASVCASLILIRDVRSASPGVHTGESS